MAQSEKYSFFNKNKNGGFLGKSYSQVVSQSITVYQDCDQLTPSTVYISINDTLQVGTYVYSDASLQTLTTKTDFSKDGIIYNLTSGIILDTSPCYNIWEGTQACNDTPVTVYSEYNSNVLELGTALYFGPELTELYDNNVFIKDGIVYKTGSGENSGIIVTILTCLNILNNLYNNCAQSESVGPFYINGTVPFILTDGTILYQDSFGETPLNNPGLVFVYNNYTYLYDNSTGTENTGPCAT